MGSDASAETAPALPEMTWDGRRATARDRDGCFAHCLAYLLGLRSIEVPNFRQRDGNPGAHAQAWCASRGLYLISLPSSAPFELLLTNLEKLNPSLPFMLTGQAKTESSEHAVVCCVGKIVCDPGENGISGPGPDGNFWIHYVGAAIPKAIVRTGRTELG
jgi:hypothetical protein